MKARVENRLAEIRKSRGAGAAELARRVNVSRQTIYAIEAGTYVPNTEVALNLARELDVTVDQLFSLPLGGEKLPESLTMEVLSAEAPIRGQPVRICRVGARWVGVPTSAADYYMQEADGMIKRTVGTSRRAELVVFAKEEAAQNQLILAGCDPATGVLSSMVKRISGVEVVSAAASSKLALTWLSEEKVHVAGSHLEDPKTGEYNLPFLQKQFPGQDFSVATFARWEEGLVLRPGNPKCVRKIEDLAQRNLRFVNREIGSGSRGLLDRLLEKAGMDGEKVHGYDRIEFGHLAAARCVVSGDADVCLATRSAAQAFGLDFVGLSNERYDLVMRRKTLELPAVKAFLDVLQRATLRRKLEMLAGYDMSETGNVIA